MGLFSWLKSKRPEETYHFTDITYDPEENTLTLKFDDTSGGVYLCPGDELVISYDQIKKAFNGVEHDSH